MVQKTNVLIIGAGPTGLMAACQLRQQGIEPIIIDKKEGPTPESRALVLHARSLEIYDQLGIANDALLQGEIVEKVQFIVKNKKVQELPLGKLGKGVSPFPFLLVLEQSKNEQLLYSALKKRGGEVLWKTELLSIKQDEKGVTAVVRNDEETFDIKADFVIAADGGKSTVRHALEVPFTGSTYEHIFYVADTALDWTWGHDSLSIFLSQKTFLGLFPMQGEKRFRVVGILPSSYQNEHPASFDELIPLIQKDAEVPLRFSDISWFSVYRLHHRCMEIFRKEKVFFTGDAAHIHSPAGGQGMNTGLQDAYNLSWKLAMVLKGQADEKLLDTYEQERLPFARNLVATTDRLFGLIVSGKWYHRWLRLYILPNLLPVFMRSQKIKLQLFKRVSQIGIKYINSDLTINRMMQTLSIKAGERFPYVCTKDGESIYYLMKAPSFHALFFALSPESSLGAELAEAAEEVGSLMKVINLSAEDKLKMDFQIKRDTVILVRPDHYIGLITDEGAKVVRDYLKKLAEPKKEDGIKLPLTHP